MLRFLTYPNHFISNFFLASQPSNKASPPFSCLWRHQCLLPNPSLQVPLGCLVNHHIPHASPYPRSFHPNLFLPSLRCQEPPPLHLQPLPILTTKQTTMSNPSYTSQPNSTSLPPPNFLLVSQSSPCLPPNLVFLQPSTVVMTEFASRFPNNPNSFTFLSSSITLTNIITSVTRKPKPCFTALYLPRSNHPKLLTTMHGPHPTAPNRHEPLHTSVATTLPGAPHLHEPNFTTLAVHFHLRKLRFTHTSST